MEQILNYTITSSDQDNYSLIRTNLQAPVYPVTKFIVTNLTTKCSFILLDDHDYITINGIKYKNVNLYSDLNSTSLIEIINELIKSSNVFITIDETNRLEFEGTDDFIIDSMSYNFLQLTGLYNTSFPISSIASIYEVKSVGNYLLTPILYLVSNLGARCYRNQNYEYCDQKILMRINNSFSSNFPVVSSNAEFSTIVPSNNLSDLELKLVDANLHDIKLLSPMYISAIGEGIPNTIRFKEPE